MAEQRIPSPPKGSGPGGRALWRSILVDFRLDQHELTLLREAVRVTDRLDALAVVIAAQGVMDPETGKAHPALVEARQQEITLARLLAVLRMPTGEEGDEQASARRP